LECISILQRHNRADEPFTDSQPATEFVSQRSSSFVI
jgi:hypothetical protein